MPYYLKFYVLPETRKDASDKGSHKGAVNILAVIFAVILLFPDPTVSQNQGPADFLKNHLLRPPMQIFEPNEDYEGDSQNWSSLELDNGLLLIANNNGILQYDGREFTRIAAVNKSVRDLTKDEDGDVYVSGMNCFGRLYTNKKGVWQFEDLWEAIPEVKGDNVAWEVEAFEGKVYVRFSNGVVRYDQGEANLLLQGESYNSGDYMRSDDHLYVIINHQDLYQIINGELEFAYKLSELPSNNGEPLGKGKGENGIPGNKVLINYYKDLFQFDPQTNSFLTIDMPDILHDFVNNHMGYSAIILENGYLAVGSITGGLLILDENYNQVLHLTTEDGLHSNIILNLHEDPEGGLWLLTDHGIVRLDFYYPYWQTIKNQYINGAVLSIKPFQGQLFIGTNQSGYIVKDDEIVTPSDDKNIDSVWEMEEIVMPDGKEHLILVDNVELASYEDNGFYVLDRNTSYNLRSGEIWDLLYHPDYPGWIFGAENGHVFRIRLDYNDSGRLEIKEYDILHELSGILRFLRFDRNGSLWFEEGTGQVVRLYFEDGIDGFFKEAPEPRVQNFSEGKEDIPEFISYAHNKDDLYFLGKGGSTVFQIKPESQTGTSAYFNDDFTQYELDQPIQGFSTPVDYGDEVFYTTHKDSIVRLQKNGELIKENLVNVYGAKYSNGHFDGENLYLVSEKGVMGYRKELAPYHKTDLPYKASISSVHVGGDSLLINPITAENVIPPAIDFADNQLRFTFTPSSYIFGPDRIEYQTMLEPFDQEWTSWSDRYIREFTALPPGDYTFMVQARNPYGTVSEPSRWDFTIITPWFRTWWAILFFISGFFAVLFFMVYRYIGYNKKITMQRIKAEQVEKLELLDKMRTNLFMNISHELRTPLTLVMGPIEQLKSISKNLGSEWERRIMMASRNGRRLHQLVEQVLDLTRLDSQKMTLKLESVELNSFLRRTLESFESLSDRKKISLNAEIPTKKIIIGVDIDKFEKIIVNVISNAIKFTPINGSVRLELKEGDKDVEIRISDSGKGIEDNRLPYIFDRFNTTGDQLTEGGKGLGIGLAITKEFVELHNGTITVESKINRGTIFVITLPVKAALEGKETEPTETGEHVLIDEQEHLNAQVVTQNGEKGITILIVEDNDDMRTYIFDLLNGHGRRIETAVNGVEGKKKLALIKPDLIISDIMMPEMDGLAFADHVRSVPEYRQTPLIILSAKSEVDDRIKGFNIGVNEYLTKPFNAVELTVRVNNLIKYKREREKEISAAGEVEEDDSHETVFINQLKQFVDDNITEKEISTESLSAAANLSRRQLYRRLKSATGFTPAEFIREIRLKKTLHILEQKQKKTVAEVAYAAGFSNPAHFSRLFRDRYGVLPSKYINRA
ncbi:MAG: ATP-binding protein [Balneolales bacterium]